MICTSAADVVHCLSSFTWSPRFWQQPGRVVFTNGCFDVLHVGHAYLFQCARAHGNDLVVGVNSDASVRALKGAGRPVFPADERVELVHSMKCCNYVFPFDDLRVDQVLRDLRPDVWVKGGDYTLETLDAGEVAAAREIGCEIVIVPERPGLHTSDILRRAT